MPLADHVQILDKQRNTGVSIQIPGSFWSGMPAADERKMFSATVQSWEPSYKWPKGKTVGAFRVSVDHDEECYYLSEQQYKQSAGDAAVWTTLAEERKTEQAQLAKAEAQAETAICSPCSPSESSPGPRRSLIYRHFKPLRDGRSKCLCCGFRVMKSAKSTSALFSHLKRRHYFLYLQLATGSPHSKISVDPHTGTLHKLMPFRQAFAHH